MMGVAGIGAGAAAAGAAKEVFDYNRENYMFDSEMRFQRFTAVRGFMNAQFSQYREDIRGMTELTAGKMDMNWTCGTLFMCVCAALSDAGRIGMHGAAPPGWLMALYSGHIFTTILYMSTAMWLALHASMRAQCGALSLLTRKVRLPIPSMAQLDAARNMGSGFERQKAGDMFRVPFMQHPQHIPDLPEAGDAEDKSVKKGKKSKAAKADPKEGFNSTGRASVPSWVRDEQVVDKGLGNVSTDADVTISDTALPEHFKLYAEAQQEWWPYEVYARIMLLYGVMQFLYAVAYYSLGTAISELRGFWISWSLPGLFIAAQVLILRLDTFQDKKGQTYLPHLEWAGHLAPLFATIGTTLEYRYTYNPAAVTVTWGFVLASFFGHGLFHLRLLDIAWPHFYMEEDPPETPGHPWWPANWKVPPRFAKSIWIIAPPKKLESGVRDMGNEAAALKQSGGGVTCRRRKGAAKGAPPKSAKTMPALKQQLDHLEGVFEEAYDPSLWPHISKEGQAKIHELHMQLGRAKSSYDALGGHGAPEQVEHIAALFSEIEFELLEVDHVRAGARHDGAYTGQSPFHRFQTSRSGQLPWNLARIAILTVAWCWFFMMVATAVEIVLGSQSLMKPPGEPPWIRDQKYRHWTPSFVHYSDQPTPADYRLYTAPEANYEPWSSESPTTRRLRENITKDFVSDAVKDLIMALPKLEMLADAVDKRSDVPNTQPPILPPGDAAQPGPKPFLPPALKVMSVEWPQMFEPQHLVCGRGTDESAGLVALTARGMGAALGMPAKGEAPAGVKAVPFVLDGAMEHGALAGAGWTPNGLEVVTQTGKVLRCPGNPWEGSSVLACSEMPHARLSFPRGARLASAAMTETSTGDRLAALQFEEAPGLLMLHSLSQGQWRPSGEIHVLPPGAPRGQSSRVGLSFSAEAELLVAMPNGEVQRRHFQHGASSLISSSMAPQKEWRSACAVPATKEVLRLALQRSESEEGAVWLPEIVEAH